MYYWDKELNQTSKYELRQTPAWFFLRDPISFGGDVVVTRFERAGGIDPRHAWSRAAARMLGSLTLVFPRKPARAGTMDGDRSAGQDAPRSSLYDVQFGVALDPGLFQYQFAVRRIEALTPNRNERE